MSKQGASITFLPVNNTQHLTLNTLRHEIESVAKEQDYVGAQIPLKWARCVDSLLKSAKQPLVSLSQVKQLAKTLGIKSTKEFLEMLELFHNQGVIVFLNSTSTLSSKQKALYCLFCVPF